MYMQPDVFGDVGPAPAGPAAAANSVWKAVDERAGGTRDDGINSSPCGGDLGLIVRDWSGIVRVQGRKCEGQSDHGQPAPKTSARDPRAERRPPGALHADVAWYENRGLQKIGSIPTVFEDVAYTPMELTALAARRLLANWE